eukprot:4531532-Pleurochrysis_carterae.AAC.2
MYALKAASAKRVPVARWYAYPPMSKSEVTEAKSAKPARARRACLLRYKSRETVGTAPMGCTAASDGTGAMRTERVASSGSGLHALARRVRSRRTASHVAESMRYTGIERQAWLRTGKTEFSPAGRVKVCKTGNNFCDHRAGVVYLVQTIVRQPS